MRNPRKRTAPWASVSANAGGNARERIGRYVALPEGQKRLISILGRADSRADDSLKRVSARVLARPGNRGDNLELWYANRVGDVLLVLTQEAPEDCRKPGAKPGTDTEVDVVLVVPELVSELLAFHASAIGTTISASP
jgi:hypothetical protein